ncbi:hypothetical protein CCACVL1_19154, partial [Corchorus capsularis]
DGEFVQLGKSIQQKIVMVEKGASPRTFASCEVLETGSVEELIGIDLSNHVVAATEDYSKC